MNGLNSRPGDFIAKYFNRANALTQQRVTAEQVERLARREVLVEPFDPVPPTEVSGGGCECCPDDWLGDGDPPLVPPGPGGDTPPSPPPGDTGACSGDDLTIVNGPFTLVWSRYNLNASGTYLEQSATASITAYLRPSSASAKSFIDLSPFSFVGDALDHLHVYAINSVGTIVATATISGTTATFSPSVATLIAGFRIELDGLTDTDFEWTAGSLVGTFDLATISGGTVVPTLVPNGGPVLTAGSDYRLRIVAGGVDAYKEVNGDTRTFPYLVYTCLSGTNAVDVIRTNCEVALVDTTYSGNMGSRSVSYVLGDGSCNEFDYYNTKPIGALHAFLWNEDNGAGNPLTQTQLDALIPEDNDGANLLGSDIFFQAAGSQVGVKIASLPRIPYEALEYTNWRCSVWNASATGDRQVTLVNNSAYSLCGTL